MSKNIPPILMKWLKNKIVIAEINIVFLSFEFVAIEQKSVSLSSHTKICRFEQRTQSTLEPPHEGER